MSGHVPDERRDRVDAFVRRQFGWQGTLRLHRAALGFDILRAAVNLLLSPVLALMRLLAWPLNRLGPRRLATWMSTRRLLMRTSVSARIEAALVADLFDVPLPDGRGVPSRAALTAAILAAPRLRETLRARGIETEAGAVAERMMGAIEDYTGTRSAIAEFTTALFALLVGAIAFHALTPGMISMAPGVAEAVTLRRAIADFPLGDTLGAVWYGWFPAAPSPAVVGLTAVGLLALGAVATAFAGTIADPVQARLGLHRRRLLRLLDTVDAELAGSEARPFVARGHLFVRVFDLWDGVLTLLRVFRG